jgi:hypothetical protein
MAIEVYVMKRSRSFHIFISTLLLFMIGVMYNPMILYASSTDINAYDIVNKIITEIKPHYVRISALSPRVVSIEIDTRYFYNYKGLYLISVHELARIDEEHSKILCKLVEITTGKHLSEWFMRDLDQPIQVSFDDTRGLQVKINQSIIRPFVEKGVYPVRFKIIEQPGVGDTGVVVIHVSGNSTNNLSSITIEDMYGIMARHGIKDFKLAIIVKRIFQDPVFDVAFENDHVSRRIWDEVENGVHRYIEESDSTTIPGSDYTLAYNACFDGIFVTAYHFPLETRIIAVSPAFFHYCIPSGEKLLYANITGIVNSKRAYSILKAYLDLIIRAFKELNLKYYGTIVELYNIRVIAPVPSPAKVYSTTPSGETLNSANGLNTSTIAGRNAGCDEYTTNVALVTVLVAVISASLIVFKHKLKL